MPRFNRHSQQDRDGHRFEAYDCHPDADDLVGELAAAVRGLYVDPATLRDRLLEAARDIDDVADVDEIRAAVENVTQAAIPEASVRLAQPQLDTARNELGEVIAYAALERVHDAVVPAKRVREKEVPGLPSRGLDALALSEAEALTLLLSEVKTSDDAASPPGVVGQGASSLQAQLRAIVGSSDRVLVELNWAFKHANEEHEGLVARAILIHTRGELPLVAVPVLVRPARCHRDTDYGIFANDPGSLAPATVRFCLVRLPEELDDLAEAVYRRAREAA